MRSWAASAALAALTAAPFVTANLSKIGNITLFSDTSCADPVFMNTWGMGRDFCAIVDNSASSPLDVAFQSYILNERPWCDNGSRPYLNVYRDETCAELIHSYEPGALYNPTGPDADGTCVAPGGSYKAMAFVCDGFEGAWGSEGTVPAISTGVVSSETLSVESSISDVQSTASASVVTDVTKASATPNTASETTAASTASITSSANNGTASSPSTTTSAPTSAFTGSASNLGTSVPLRAFIFPLLVLLAYQMSLP